MKYFKDQAGTVFAYEADGSQDQFVPAHLEPITEAEADVLRFPPDQVLAAERARMVVSRFQARAALHIAGLLPQIEAAIGAADPLVQIAWNDAQEFRRNSPTISALAAALGLGDETIDQLFRDAARIAA